MTESYEAPRSYEVLMRAEEQGSLGRWNWAAGADRMEWSAGMYRLFGMLPHTEIPTLALCRQLIHPDDLAMVSDWRAMLTPGRLDECVFRVIRADNAVRRVRMHGRIDNDAAGTLQHISGICIDITDDEVSVAREHSSLTCAQVRAARAYLGWTALELAERAGVSFSTVRRVEMPGPRAVRDENLDAIRDAFTRSGVRFVVHDDGAIGIVGR